MWVRCAATVLWVTFSSSATSLLDLPWARRVQRMPTSPSPSRQLRQQQQTRVLLDEEKLRHLSRRVLQVRYNAAPAATITKALRNTRCRANASCYEATTTAMKTIITRITAAKRQPKRHLVAERLVEVCSEPLVAVRAHPTV
jgi:hypothetical protein